MEASHSVIDKTWEKLPNCASDSQEDIIEFDVVDFENCPGRKHAVELASNIGRVSFPNCPEITDSEIAKGLSEEKQRNKIWRRKFAKKLGASMLVGSALITAAGYAQATYSEYRWKPHGASVVEVPEAEHLADSGTANLVFMGFGQYDGSNAARQYFEETGEKIPTYWVEYPNRTFTPEDLAPTIADFIRDNQIDKLNIVGVSMGTAEALETMKNVVIFDSRDQNHVNGSTKNNQQRMPAINYFVAYSSPADRNDAVQGDKIHTVVEVANVLGYEGDFAGKLAYSLAVRFSDNPVDLITPNAIPGILVDSLGDANNDSPPQQDMSQLRTLDNFDFKDDAPTYQDLKVITPQMKFVFISSPSDGIVYDHSSDVAFTENLDKLGVTDVNSLTTDADHANTAASAEAFGDFLALRRQLATSSLNSSLHFSPS